MPLSKGKSEKAFKHNVEVEMEAGRPQKQALAIAYSMKRRHKAMGGEMSKHSDHCDGCEMCMPSEPRHMAEGGVVDRILSRYESHEDQEQAERQGDMDELEELADSRPNDFDYLVVNGGPGHKADYDGANSGDMLSDEREDHDRADIVSRVMRSWKKKDRLPRVR